MAKYGSKGGVDNRSFVPREVSPESGPRRHAMDLEQSKRHFEKHASKTHYKNLPNRLPMRGGIRM